MKNESEFTHLYAGLMSKLGAYVIHQAGGMYQSGQPDLRITTPHGYTVMAELKMWRNLNPPYKAEQLRALLDGPQRNVIPHELWTRNNFCPIIASDINKPTVVYLTYKDYIIHWTFVESAKFLATYIQGDEAKIFACLKSTSLT